MSPDAQEGINCMIAVMFVFVIIWVTATLLWWLKSDWVLVDMIKSQWTETVKFFLALSERIV